MPSSRPTGILLPVTKVAQVATWKCTKSVWQPGSARTRWGSLPSGSGPGSLQHSPYLLDGFKSGNRDNGTLSIAIWKRQKGVDSWGSRTEERGKEWKGRRDETEGRRRRGEISPPRSFLKVGAYGSSSSLASYKPVAAYVKKSKIAVVIFHWYNTLSALNVCKYCVVACVIWNYLADLGVLNAASCRAGPIVSQLYGDATTDIVDFCGADSRNFGTPSDHTSLNKKNLTCKVLSKIVPDLTISNPGGAGPGRRI